MTLKARDCSPILPRPAPADAAWLSRLATASRHGDIVLRLEEGREDEPVVRCEVDGTWWAGRYVGSVVFEGRRLDIAPRFGEETLKSWIAGAFNLALVDTPGRLEADDSFVARLLAAVWSRAFVAAARHGPPSLRADTRESGSVVRGRIDVPATILLRAAGRPGVASIRREKSLDHAIAAAIVAAWAELSRTLGRDGDWLPERLAEIIPHMVGAVGSRPRVPRKEEIDRVRLTPITAGFRSLAELSARIASRRGLSPLSSDGGECKGLLLDVAELWELYVLGALRRAWPGADVAHGTRDLGETRPLLTNRVGSGIGIMKPDAVVRSAGRALLVADAKYKRLLPTQYTQAPQREDIYQMAAYVSRFGAGGAPGALIYPEDPESPGTSPAEAGGPWMMADGSAISFITLPHRVDAAADKLIRVLGDLNAGSPQATGRFAA